MPKMSADDLIRAKIYRLEELRKYQAYYGPNTPYPVIAEINELEQELRRLLNAGSTRPTQLATKKKKKPPAKKKKRGAAGVKLWPMSSATFDAVVTIAFIGFLFLLGVVLYVTYENTRPGRSSGSGFYVANASPTLRPTFTPTIVGASANSIPQDRGVTTAQVNLPPAEREPTPLATPVPSLTPTPAPPATNTPLPTETPPPAKPPPAAAVPAAAPATATPAPAPAPSFPFAVVEQGNRVFQKTSYHIITVYIAIVSEGNVPMGGYKVVADHSSGEHLESGLSDWSWSAANCLDCGYIKQGNLKMDLGPYRDGVWNLYLADPDGNPLSPTVPLTYSADPEQWVWDFLLFQQRG